MLFVFSVGPCALRAGQPPQENAPLAATADIAAPQADQRGGAEEDRLRGTLEEKREPEPDEATWPWQRPLPKPASWEKVLPFVMYLSVRANTLYTDGSWELADGASRMGLFGHHKARGEDDLFYRLETGFNFFDTISGLTTRDASNTDGDDKPAFNPRLYYLGYASRHLDVRAGKNWSAYYDVAGLTDRFAVFGGTSVGVYNAGTDGGGSGTGRADNVLQIKGKYGEWDVALQGQTQTPVPTFTGRYALNLGASILGKMKHGADIGLAYNRAVPESITGEMKARGFTGEDQCVVLGAGFRHHLATVAATVAYLENHEADNEEVFFDALGAELFIRVDMSSVLRFVGGWNYLDPKGAYPGAFRNNAYVAGVHYALGRVRDYERMVYVECELNEGRKADGSRSDNVFAAGLRYRFAH